MILLYKAVYVSITIHCCIIIINTVTRINWNQNPSIHDRYTSLARWSLSFYLLLNQNGFSVGEHRWNYLSFRDRNEAIFRETSRNTLRAVQRKRGKKARSFRSEFFALVRWNARRNQSRFPLSPYSAPMQAPRVHWYQGDLATSER